MNTPDLDRIEAELREIQNRKLENIRRDMALLSADGGRAKFPVEALPARMQAFIKGYCDVYGSAPDHYGLALLTVAGTVIGNSAWVQERGSTHPPILYSVIVDNPSTGKTPIIRTALQPIWEIEKEYRRIHIQKMKEAEEQEAKKMPAPREMVLSDSTIESLYSSLYHNPRGVLIFRDEIKGWLASMGRYTTGGGDESFYLESWNGAPYKVNRKKEDIPLLIMRPFAAILGGTQPKLLSEFAQGSKRDNGFLARFLFSFPSTSKKPDHSNRKPAADHMEWWSTIIRRLKDLPTEEKRAEDITGDWEVTPTILELSTGAQALYRDFFNKNASEINTSDDEVVMAILGKFDSYVLRIALILELLHWADGAKGTPTLDDVYSMSIGKKAMLGAIQIVEYFRNTALKVVGRLASPVDALPAQHQVWYWNVGDEDTGEVTRKQGAEVARIVGLSARTADRLLQRPDLFKWTGRGIYRKLYLA